MKSAFIILLVIFCKLVCSQEKKSNYIFQNSTYQPDPTTKKIKGTNINLLLDTTSLQYLTMGVPNYYKNQKVKDGIYQMYFLQDTSKKALDLTFKNGYLVKFKKYWFNDSLKATGQLKYGLYQGVWKRYHSNGKVSSIFHYYNGWHREHSCYYKSGVLKRESKELEIDNKKYRLWETKDYYSNGQLAQVGLTKNGYKIKEWRYFNCDGSIKKIEKYKVKDGLWLGTATYKKNYCQHLGD